MRPRRPSPRAPGPGTVSHAQARRAWVLAWTQKGRTTVSRPAGKRAYETVHPETIGHLRLLTVNGIGIDVDGHRVFADGKEIQLARKEYDLLHTLIEHAGRTLSRREILDSVWGDGYVDRNKTLDVHIRRLRRKIDPGSASPRIRTVRGIGYVLDVDASQLTRMR